MEQNNDNGTGGERLAAHLQLSRQGFEQNGLLWPQGDDGRLTSKFPIARLNPSKHDYLNWNELPQGKQLHPYDFAAVRPCHIRRQNSTSTKPTYYEHNDHCAHEHVVRLTDQDLFLGTLTDGQPQLAVLYLKG